MAQPRSSMRKIRELLRLKHELGRSHREIAASLAGHRQRFVIARITQSLHSSRSSLVNRCRKR